MFTWPARESRVFVALGLWLCCGGGVRAAQTEGLELRGPQGYDGAVTLTRDAQGRLVLRDADLPAGVRLGELGVAHAAHAGLAGLLADDHPHYLTPARHGAAHTAEANAALAVPPDLNGNVTLGGHLADAQQHLRRAAAEAVSGAWTFSSEPLFAGGLSSGAPVHISTQGAAALVRHTAQLELTTVTEWRLPAQAASVPRPAPAGTAWILPSLITALDDSMTGVTFSDRTQFLAGTGYGFSLPAQATVLGVELQATLTATDDMEPAVDDFAGLVLGGAVQTVNRGGTRQVTGLDVVPVAWGGAQDRFGAALTPALVNAAGFGAALAFRPATPGQPCAVYADALRVRVHYKYPLTAQWSSGIEAGRGAFVLQEGTQPVLSAERGGLVGVHNLLRLGVHATAPPVVEGALCNIAGHLHWGRAGTWRPLE